MTLQHGLGEVLHVLLISACEAELVLKIIDAILIVIAGNARAPFEALESGLALGADLVALSALILVASPADREGALVAGHEELAVGRETYIVPTNLTDLAAQLLQRLGPGFSLAAYDDELVPVVRAGDETGARLHCFLGRLEEISKDAERRVQEVLKFPPDLEISSQI